MRPGFVADDFKVFEAVVKERIGLAVNLQGRISTRFTRELKLDLFHMVVVKMAIAAGPDKVSDFEITLLRHHMRQQSVTRDIEGHTQENIAGTLV